MTKQLSKNMENPLIPPKEPGRRTAEKTTESKEVAGQIGETREQIETLSQEKQAWQATVNEAFEAENLDLIKILLRARPELKPSPAIVRAKLTELITTRPSNWENVYSDVQSVSNIQPDQSIVAQEFSSLFAQVADTKEKEEILDQLKTFKEVTGFTPSPEEVQEKYRSILQAQQYYFTAEDLFKYIQSLTGIRPDRVLFDELLTEGRIDDIKEYAPLFGLELSGEIVQSIYEAYFQKHGYLDTYTISKLPEKPNATLMQRVYSKLLEERPDRWISAIQDLEQETGVKPEFSNKKIQPIFKDFLSKGRYGRSGYLGIEKVVELTGIQPSPELIRKRAIQIVDKHIDQGKKIREEIQRLEAVTGTKIEIPEQEIQTRYQQAMEAEKSCEIINLYVAFGIKPAIDDEAAQQFLASFLDKTYQNPITALEKVFGIKLEISSTEASLKFDEALTELNFDKIKQIQELTGKQPDQKKLEAALAQKLENEATRPPYERKPYEGDWVQNTKRFFGNFKVPFSEKAVVRIYEQLIKNETIYTDNLVKLHEITGVAFSPELAQKAYKKIISPDYVTSVLTDEGLTYLYERTDALKKIFQISGDTQPNIPETQLQNFYRAQIEDYRKGISSIKKMAEMTGVAPQFDATDINQLYQKWIRGDRTDRIKSVREITGIELQLDEEISQYASQNIDEGLAKASSANYTREEYGRKEFDSNRLENDLRKIAKLIEATGISPNPARVQALYDAALTDDPYCFTVIRDIAEASGVEPQFSPEQLQAKGQQLLESGSLRGLASLLKYGEFVYDQATVEKGFQALLDTCRTYGEYDRRYYYDADWSDWLLRLQKLSGIAPNEEHLAQVFSHFIQFQRRRYHVVTEALDFLRDKFDTEVDETLAQKIYVVLLKDKNLETIRELKEKTKIIPAIPLEILQGIVDEFIGDKQYDELARLKKILELKSLPVSEADVQEAYARVFSTDDFTKEDSASGKIFFAIYALTGVHPEYSEEQLDQVYRNANFGSWQSFSEVLGAMPSGEAVQHKYYQFLVGCHSKFDKVLNAIEQFSGVKIEETTVKKALETCAQKAKIERMIKIVEVTGLNPEINTESVQQGYRTLMEEYESIGSLYHEEKIAAAINYFHGFLGIAPDKKVLSLTYQKLIGEAAYQYAYEQAGKKEYPQWWDILRKKFGISAEAVQGTYYLELNQEKLWLAMKHFDYIQSFSGKGPDIDKMAQILQEQGVERIDIEKRLQSIYQAELLAGHLENVQKLTEQWSTPFQVSEAEAQLLYARILMTEGEHQIAMFQFMAENVDFEPAQEIKENRYKELIEKSNPDEILEFRNMMCWEAAMSKEEIEKHIFQAGKGSVLADNYDHALFNTYHKHIIGQIGADNFDKYKDQILDLFRVNEVLILQEQDFKLIEQNKLNTLNFSEINLLNLSEFSLATNKEAEKVYLVIKETGRDWQDSEITRKFEKGSVLFGYHRMFAFAKAGQRHDALYGFNKILELHKISGLTPERFYHNILQQVAMDTGTYGENNDTSFQTLNNIAQGFQDNIEETLAQAREIKEIPQLDKLLENLRRPQDVFGSWKMLMQYKELVLLLERKEILKKLSREKNPKLREYVSTLLFHPSVTNTHAVKLFWKNPYDFFELEDANTSGKLHNLKKPTNYVHIPNLDLTPAELRDALVDGALDGIQVWQPNLWRLCMKWLQIQKRGNDIKNSHKNHWQRFCRKLLDLTQKE